MPDSTVLVSTLGTVALTLVYLAIHRRSSSLNDGDNVYQGGGVMDKKDVLLPCRFQNVKPASTTHGNGTCKGLLDLIQGHQPELEARDIGPLMTLTELSKARMVIVVIGPPSTEVFQDYVLNKLFWYLRWSGLERKHFVASGQEMKCATNPGPSGRKNASSRLPSRVLPEGNHLSGEAAATNAVVVQDSARSVANWLHELEGGVAVVEAGGNVDTWARTSCGREALELFVRFKAGPDVEFLWVEVVPHELVVRRRQRRQQRRRQRGVTVDSGSTSGEAAKSDENGKPFTNGLSAHTSRGPGERSTEGLSKSGVSLGSGGTVNSESIGEREEDERREGFYVLLADQGKVVESHLPDKGASLAGRVGAFVAALRVKKSRHGYPVYLTRHGESLMNKEGIMGGNTRLSEDGAQFALDLEDFIAVQSDARQGDLSVWYSPMKRAVHTARAVKCHRLVEWQALRELDTGIFNGCFYEQAEREHPKEFAERARDKLKYQYPQGEGYLDVVNRVHSVVVALEEQEEGPVLIVSHQASPPGSWS